MACLYHSTEKNQAPVIKKKKIEKLNRERKNKETKRIRKTNVRMYFFQGVTTHDIRWTKGLDIRFISLISGY